MTIIQVYFPTTNANEELGANCHGENLSIEELTTTVRHITIYFAVFFFVADASWKQLPKSARKKTAIYCFLSGRKRIVVLMVFKKPCETAKDFDAFKI